MVKLILDSDEVYDTTEAGKLLGIGYATVYRWIRSGKLIPFRIGGRTFIPLSEIERIKNDKHGESAEGGEKCI